ncbi:MAG: hypothetical protein ACJAZO_004189 [Myxococcota bacterium]|jgi:hypothetical protein
MIEIKQECSGSYILVAIVEMAALGSAAVGVLLALVSGAVAALLFLQPMGNEVTLFMGGMVFAGSAVGLVAGAAVLSVLLRAVAGMLKAILDTAVATQSLARQKTV